MYTEQLKELVLISRSAGSRSDYVQGGGGNTSVKLDDNLMAVKASGFMLKDISQNEGFVVFIINNNKAFVLTVILKRKAENTCRRVLCP